ncbi:MAG: nuclear transport factor 2 family protein [bacterium]
MRHFIAIGLLASRVCIAQANPATASGSRPASAQEQEAVRRAALDYLEGFYEGDTAKLVRALRPEMFKYGFWKEKDSTRYSAEKMTYDEAIAYARRFKASKRTTPATAPREVQLFDVQNQTASAKVRAWWGTDYLLLGKYDGRWMISHILWQGP